MENWHEETKKTKREIYVEILNEIKESLANANNEVLNNFLQDPRKEVRKATKELLEWEIEKHLAEASGEIGGTFLFNKFGIQSYLKKLENRSNETKSNNSDLKKKLEYLFLSLKN